MGEGIKDRVVSATKGASTKCSNHGTSLKSLAWRLIFPLQLAVAILLVYRLTAILLGGGGATLEKFHNSYCLNPTSNETSCVHDYNFKKVVYFWCDGISWDTADPIFAQFPKHNNLFKVRHKENPWSAWIFATFFTGKAERNMGVVKNDNLIYQFYLAGLKVLLGAENTRTYVFNQLDLSYLDSDAVKFWDRVTQDEARMFHWLFECHESSSPYTCSKMLLDQGKAEDRSMFFESFILDHRVHEVNTKFGSMVLALRDKLAEDLAYVKKWVDANPEYLLVVVSDHGQKVSGAEVDIHGNWLSNGNEGWVMFYNPTIDTIVSTPGNPTVLNTVDVAPTFWQFFSANGVSIPAESVGLVTPIATHTKTRFRALRTNALQIRAYLEREGTFSYGDQKYRNALDKYKAGNPEGAVEDMTDYIAGLSQKFVEEGRKIPYKLPLFTTLLYLVATIMLQFGSGEALWAAARSVGFGVLASPYLTWIIMAVFFTQSSEQVGRHQLYAYAIPMCAFLASYTFKRLTKSLPPKKKDHHRLAEVEFLEKPSELSVSLSASERDVKEEECSDDGAELGSGVSGGESEDGDSCKSSEIDTQEAEKCKTEERQYLYFEMWDYSKQRKFLDALLSLVNYILGTQKIPRSSVDFWLMYSVVVFAVFSCTQISFLTKRFIWGDIGGLYAHPPFWHSLAISVLYLEFRWQRILLTSNLELNSTKWTALLHQIIHPAFWPLTIKTVAYFAMLLIAFDADNSTVRTLYAISFAHIAVLMFCPTYIQRDFFLPLFIISFIINTAREKILLCMFVVVLQFFSNTLERPSKFNRHILPTVLVMIIALGHFYFSVLYQLPYSLNQMNLTIPGIDDITKYPNFSIMMMGVHYLGVFLMLIPFIIRLVTPSPPPLRPFKIGCLTFGHVPISSDSQSTVKSDRRYVMTLLMFCTSLTVFLYYMFSMDEVTDTPLIWAFTICAVSIGYGTTVVVNDLTDGLVQVLKFTTKWISTKIFISAKLANTGQYDVIMEIISVNVADDVPKYNE